MAANNTVHQHKPIRFVTNSEGPYAKRRRINSACTTCRRRKTRCSGERPVCGTCIQNKHECGGYGNETDSAAINEVQEEKPKKTGPRLERLDNKEESKTISPTNAADSRHPNILRHTTLRKTLSGGSEVSTSPVPADGESITPDASTLSTRNRMPYFRYFGPTAIMPGFKQMMVKVRGKRHSAGASHSDFGDSPSTKSVALVRGPTPSFQLQEETTHSEIPVYNNSDMAPAPLIIQLCRTFFTHLGCNFPFLQKERFMRDLEEKQVDPILVDAVCAMAARFSIDPLLTGKESSGDGSKASKVAAYDHGIAFAQRAKSAITDTFACPSVASVQSALLLAYDEFGASRDSGLWMYLGIAIRMAQDLGMQTLEGLRYEGRSGPNPRAVKQPGSEDETAPSRRSTTPVDVEGDNIAEHKAAERERIDTFWAVFFLDRVVSSGTGRPVTLRDRDIEISLPSLDEVDPVTSWPTPFPALIRVIHLYGRAADLLNGIRDVSHVTNAVLKKLRSMEVQLTEIYQGLSSKLHFNANNFQHYIKAGQGTNFILLHLWFHTLIVLLHQPTLLKTFEGEIEQSLPNSRELSMSSAKTIADILAFAELIDSKAGLGNPFTSQPIYIAACAFLKETALLSSSSNPQSRLNTPPEITGANLSTTKKPGEDENSMPTEDAKAGEVNDDRKKAAKHTLLAAAANQFYHRCYRGLKSLESYWSGVKYILTVLDQKAKGIGDPLLYTREEGDSALEEPRPEPNFTSPGWRRKLSWGTYLSAQGLGDVSALRRQSGTFKSGSSSMVDPSQAIGWSLTGTMNSPSTSLAVLYSNDARPAKQRQGHDRHASMEIDLHNRRLSPTYNRTSAVSPHLTSNPPGSFSSSPSDIPIMPPPNPSVFQSAMSGDPPNMSDAGLLLNLHSPFTSASTHMSNTHAIPYMTQQRPLQGTISGEYSSPQPGQHQFPTQPTSSQSINYGNMMIESQDIDLSNLGDEVLPWFEYFPPELMGMYDGTGMLPQFSPSEHGSEPP